MSKLTRCLRSFTRRGRAAVLSTASGRAESSRRGTVLVLILGALAIISIVTLLYYTVGRSDSRTAAVTVERSQVDNTVHSIANYLNSVVADSTVAVFVDGSDAAATTTAGRILVRKTWDYPFTDPFRRSVQAGGVQAAQRFNPTGSYDDVLNALTDPRRPYQPWLSSTSPTQLIPANTTATPRPYNVDTSWLQLSNFAPDGGFVNLYNLAPNINGQRVSRFDVASVRAGSNGVPNGPTSGSPEIRWGLTLFDVNGQISAPAGNVQTLPNGAQANPNIPAHWTMWQQQAFRLAKADPRYGPGAPEYVKYQYCDTDGDGMMDARWTELVDGFDPNSVRSILPRDDRYRWFIAARAVDLSSLVNVNTGLDQRMPPGASGQAPASTVKLGLYPDVDLYRLLRGDDNYQIYTHGYDMLQAFGGETLFGNNAYDRDMTRRIGEVAYNSIRWSLRRENAKVPDGTFDLRTTAVGGLLPALTADQRANEYLKNGGHADGSFFVGPEQRISLRSAFGMADLLELLTRSGVNDPNVTSRLEQAVDGQLSPSSGGSLNEARVGPLRSVRPDAAERGTADDFENAGAGDGVLDLDAFARSTFDQRQHLTTISGGRSLVSTPIGTTPVGVITVNEMPLDAVDAALRVSGPAANRNPQSLFRGYTGALMPYPWRNGFWNSNYARFRTLCYGNNPELAIRFAAHMAANFGDMFDIDRNSGNAIVQDFSGYTVLLDSSARGTLGGSPTVYPWWTTNAGKMDLTDAYLPTGGASTTSPAINVYGIEAQPFITQAVSIVLYTDAPRTAGGDDENSGNIPPNLPEITINGTTPGATSGRNADFLGQILAFQLTNPFDVPIPLSDAGHTQNYQALADTTYTTFYLEFNGNFFKLALDGSAGLQGVILRPGETRTFYALSNDLADMQARVDRVADTASGAPGTPPNVLNFIENQLAVRAFPGQYTYTNDVIAGGARVKPVLMRRLDPTTGQSITTGTDLLGGTNLTAKRNVYLWRTPASTANSSRGDRSRHMLADRLFDPGATGSTTPTLDRTMPVGNQDINLTEAGPDPTPIGSTPASAVDNTGFTIALWGSVKRVDNPVNTPIGAIPAYCLEARWPSTQLSNFAETDAANPASLTRSDFDTRNNADITVERFFNKTMGVAGPIISPPGNPGLFAGVFILSNGTYATITAPAHLKRHGPHVIKDNLDGHAFDYDAPGSGPQAAGARRNLYPRIAINNEEFKDTLGINPPAPLISTLRIADLLLPLAIGPEFDPGVSPPAIPVGQSIPVDRCLTLAEALAIALNYSNPPQAGDPFSIYYRVGTTAAPSAAEPSNGSLDRGQLSLRRFTPFEDSNNNFQCDARENIRWPGIPLALNVFNVFRTIDPQFWNITRMTPGQININTAPLPVLRCLPLLSPTTDISSLPGQPGPAWQTYLTMSGTNAGTPELPDVTSDMAAAIAAYRAKSRVFTRDAAAPNLANFEDTTFDPFAVGTGDGRFTTTQINGIRETPGIGSIGEILAITTSAAAPPGRLRTVDRLDGLGSDSRRSGTLGTMSVPALSRVLNPAPTKDEVIDDYQEKLLVAQGVLNSVNVRSDVFAIWFVVHGYQRSDTENLGPADPLLPSIAKRYLLVLDRSGVTRAGQKAKVLLFKELPM